jgi:hypothetical protein
MKKSIIKSYTIKYHTLELAVAVIPVGHSLALIWGAGNLMPPDPGEVQTVTGLQLYLVDLCLLEVRVSFIVGGVKVDRAVVVRHHDILGFALLPGAGSTSIHEL